MGHKWIWPTVLGVIAVVLAGIWALPRLFPDLEWGLNELNQLSGVVSLAVAVAALVVAMWPVRSPDTPSADGGNNGGDDGDVVEVERVRTKGSVKGRVGPAPVKGGRRTTRVRRIRAGGDVIGQETTQSRQEPPR
jgi:hypothetical protein